MSVPIWIDLDLSEVPAAGDLFRLAANGHHVVLRITGAVRDGEMSRLVAGLKAALPTCSVFTSGEFQVTVFPVIRPEHVAQIADQLLEAARAFRSIARQLCTRLAHALDLSPESLVDSPRTSGQLDPEWRYHFHGLECCFTSVITGQELDVKLSFGSEFGVLDPWFFHRFLSTTLEYTRLAASLPDGFLDTARALDVLESTGHLIRVEFRSMGEFVYSGLIASFG